MAESLLEQALYERQGPTQLRLRARSSGFREEWCPAAEQLFADFGEPPSGVVFPECVFAYPLVKSYVAVVQIAAPAHAPLMFRVLVVPWEVYARCIGDPFQVAERFPLRWHSPDSDALGELPVLAWPHEFPAARTVADVQRVLQRPDGPLLLGAVQALVDGSRIVFVRSAADSALLQSLWALLPMSLRGELWPCSFAFENALAFHAVIAPATAATEFEGYLTEEQAENYPQGRYELNLQIATEAADQHELDMLFARRSSRQTLRLGLLLLVAALALLLITYVLARVH